MSERKLAPEQIDDLYLFCEEQDINYYDLQMELVDHLAAAIEKKWTEEPKLSYDKALWAVFDKFGISGFRNIRKAKENHLRKKYSRVLWQYIGEFFLLPKIILTLALTLILFSIFRISGNHLEIYILLLAVYTLFLSILLMVYKEKCQINLIQGKSFLLYDYLKSIRISYYAAYQLPASVFSIYFIGMKHSDSYPLNNLSFELILAFSVAFFSIFLVAISIYVPKRIKEDFTREFPQFVKS